MSRTLATHKLRQPIVLTTVDPATNEDKEEVLRPAGFTVVLRRPKAKDIQIMDDFGGRDIAGTMALLVRVTQLDAIEVDNLDAEDMGELGELVGKAVASGPPTGETSSAT